MDFKFIKYVLMNVNTKNLKAVNIFKLNEFIKNSKMVNYEKKTHRQIEIDNCKKCKGKPKVKKFKLKETEGSMCCDEECPSGNLVIDWKKREIMKPKKTESPLVKKVNDGKPAKEKKKEDYKAEKKAEKEEKAKNRDLRDQQTDMF